jgi:glycosyltransferase involved in cell wall biosynthesis
LPGKRPLHVAIDARLADYTAGGIAWYTLLLTRALADLGQPERFSLLRASRPTLDAELVPGVPAARLFTPPHHRLEQLALPLELLRLRPDVLHSPDFIPPRLGPWKRVITVHDLGFIYFPETLTAESRRYYGQIRMAVRRADRIIAVSRSTRDDLVKLVGADPAGIEVIYEAADPSFGPLPRLQAEETTRRLAIPPPYILFVGSFEPRKNLLVLLEAFARIRREADVRLVLAGRRGWLHEPIFRRLAEPDLEPHVRVHEGPTRAELAALYSSAAALAFPSLYEGFGLPVLEAMACGCPVVASDRASLPEIVGQAGLLVPAEDVAELAGALLHVLADGELRQALIAKGLERAGQFSWAKAAAETLAVYRRVAA